MSGTVYLDEVSYMEHQVPYLGCQYFIVTKEGFPAFVVYCVKDLRSMLTLSRTFLSAWVLVQIPPHSTNFEMCYEYGMDHAKEAIKTAIKAKFVKFHFFLSYRNGIHNNEAERIFYEIESCNYNVFFDKRKLTGGSTVSIEITQNLIRSQVFVPIISISTLQSIVNHVLEVPMEVDSLLLEWIIALGLMECNFRDFPAYFTPGSASASSSKGLLCYPIMKIWPILYVEEGDFLNSYRFFKASKAQILTMIPATTHLKAQEYWESMIQPLYGDLVLPFSPDLTIGDIFDRIVGNFRSTVFNLSNPVEYHSLVRSELSGILTK